MDISSLRNLSFCLVVLAVGFVISFAKGKGVTSWTIFLIAVLIASLGLSDRSPVLITDMARLTGTFLGLLLPGFALAGILKLGSLLSSDRSGHQHRTLGTVSSLAALCILGNIINRAHERETMTTTTFPSEPSSVGLRPVSGELAQRGEVALNLSGRPTTASNPLNHPVAATSAVARPDSNFAVLQLPLGASILVPKNWRILGEDAEKTLETSGEAAMRLAGLELPKETVRLFGANSVPSTTYATISIEGGDAAFEPELIRSASPEDLAELKAAMHQGLNQVLAQQDQRVLEFSIPRKEAIGTHPVLVMEYKRSSIKGPVIVQITTLYLGAKEISVYLSYRESEAALWKPTLAFVKQSISVSKTIGPALGSKSILDQTKLRKLPSDFIF